MCCRFTKYLSSFHLEVIDKTLQVITEDKMLLYTMTLTLQLIMSLNGQIPLQNLAANAI